MPLLKSSEFARTQESKLKPIGELFHESSGDNFKLYLGKTTSALVLYDNGIPYMIPMTISDNGNTFFYRDRKWQVVIYSSI